MQFLLRGLLAWDLTERESGLGVVYLAFGIGLLVFTPIGGVLADRWAKRTLLVLGQGTIALVATFMGCLLYTSPSPRDRQKSRMPSSA